MKIKIYEGGIALLLEMKEDCSLVISLSCRVTLFVPFRLTCLLFEGLSDRAGVGLRVCRLDELM